MATLVLTALGSAIGGPIGGALGAVLGQVVDRELLFRPAARQGPRLADLKVQTSSYGTPIPQLFGTIRVAGCVIWASDLIERRSTEGGKGQPRVTRYSYAASFAVALSARPIRGVKRIWADGNLLRGAAGDWKSRTGFRLHMGSEDQAVDPLIAAAEGAMAPAHRGTAYAVFEEMDLAPFGNRIPSLTFEVEADAGPVALGAIAQAVSDGCVLGGEAGMPVGGFSAHGEARGLIEMLTQASGHWATPVGVRMALRGGEGPARVVADAGMRAAERGAGAGVRSIAAAESAPKLVAIGHYDAARDYQAGVQRAVRPGPGRREWRIELPAVIDAGAAKMLAEGALMRAESERERRSVRLGWEALDIAPGDRVTIAGEPGLWRVARWSLEAMVVTLELLRIAPAPLPVAAGGGRVSPAPDRVHGVTVLHGFELPMLEEGLAETPRLLVAAAGTGAGWRSAALLMSEDGGGRWDAAGESAAPAVLGAVTVPPGAGSALIEDRAGWLEVVLAQDEMVLSGSDAAGLDAGRNLALVGDELLQFAQAERVAAGRWRLRGFWRGRRGTEAAIGRQAVGDRFVLIESDALAVLPVTSARIGGVVDLLASGVGDAQAVAARVVVTGASLLPPAPVHLRVERGVLRWVRRSRAGWRWRDGVEVPRGEEAERYRVVLHGADGRAETITCDVAELALPAWAMRAEVRQAGTHGMSAATTWNRGGKSDGE